MMFSIAPVTCGICKRSFGELSGAACKQCRRILCRRHFFKGFWKKQTGLCSECLDENSAPKRPAGKV
jgi:hypothetical protein